MRKGAWLGLVAAAALAGAIAGRRTATFDGATVTFDAPLESARENAKAFVVVDLYAPAKRTGTLLVFLQGNDPGDPDERSAFAAEVGETFQRRGVDVAALSFRVGVAAPLRDCASASARAIAELDRRLHPSRVVLAGRGVGAWAAAMLTLDPRLFEPTTFDAKRVAAVVGMRGTYDVANAEESPTRFVRPDAPPFLLLSAANDDPSWPRLDRNFARALAKAGVAVERHVVPFRDQHSLTHWTGAENDLGEIVAGFVEKGPTPLAPDAGVLELQQQWDEHPPLDTKDFRADASRITTRPVDAALKDTLDVLFSRYPYVLNTLPGRTYEAIDLLPWLASRPESEVGRGSYLTVTNLRGEQLHFTRAELEASAPVVVVGLDDEPNPYRLFGYYRLKHAYSWKKGPEPMPLMIRPLGAFLHFTKEAPRPNKTYAPFSLTTKSFTWTETDPLAAMADVPASLQPTMFGEQGCIKCHSFRGAGARAHHMLSTSGEAHGAFALALEEYPADVLKRFLYEQDAVARGFDVAPLIVPKAVADELFALVRSGQ
ncbi:MAG: hypothetical protein KIT84_34115 [Labilithrix sp.]|nr:hypothetical protein [Labilithrix sp.]MCW5816082.1 hypothetical protein [Labilithrix sp.]